MKLQKLNSYNKQSGFTLIELVVVIAILGILAVVAIPKFVDLTAEAGNAAASGVAGAMASGSAVNYAAQVAGKAGTTPLTSTNVCVSAEAGSLVTGITWAATTTDANTYVLSGTGNCATAGAGNAVACQVQGYKGVAQDATVICTAT